MPHGDGTLNEVVCGMAGCPNAAVTHYPGGSGNDAIKVFSDTAPFFDLERLLDADETRFDLIRCNDTYCANILSIGLDAKIGTDMVRFKRLPLVTGKARTSCRFLRIFCPGAAHIMWSN